MVASGPPLRLTLDAQMQRFADRIVDCFTGRRTDGDCALLRAVDTGNTMPLRPGALGMVVQEIASGRIVAMAGSIAAGADIDRLYPKETVQAYLEARRLADSAVGGVDLRTSAFGLAEMWRRLALRARMQADTPASHVLEYGAVPRMPVDFASTTAAARALAMASGVSASAWGGTAQGACCKVFGACPAEGLPGFLGKTGTADFLVREGSAAVKPGMQLPAKLFGGVFEASGSSYAIGVMALRVREGRSNTLELDASALAEAALALALALVRQLRRSGG